MSNLSYTQFLLKKQEILMAGQPDLPTDYEVIVIGTGLEESIIAAASARNGHNILHIDTKDYYGESWAAFTFNGLQDWIKDRNEPEKKVEKKVLEKFLKEGETLHILDNDKSIRDVNETWFAKEILEETESKNETNETVMKDLGETAQNEAMEESETKDLDDNETNVQVPSEDNDKVKEAALKTGPKWTKSKILEERFFNLDLMPRLLYSRGAMVDLLIQSNISRYTEFKTVSRVLTVLNGTLEHVPSSRADVFATKHISVVEKRILMKFLTFCLNFEEHPEVYQNYIDKTYLEFLKHEKLTDNLIHFVIHSIAMVDKKIKTFDGLKATEKFLLSLGRFGNTPFLYSSFGSGEIPQAFCRLCAVFGGTYYLGRSIEAVISDANDKCVGIISNGLRLNCQKLVMSGQTCPPDLKQVISDGVFAKDEVIERKICLAADSIMPSEKEQLTFLSVPPKSTADSYTYVTEVGHGAAVCPKGMYCLHLTKSREKNGENDLQESFSTVMPSTEDKLLWTLDFKVFTENLEALEKTTGSLFLTSGPHFELDYDLTIEKAREMFNGMFPEEPFLPRAPDPEEIILGEPEESKDSSEEPKDSSEDPKDSSKEPKDSSEDPKDSSEDPKDSSEDPKNASEETKDSSEESKDSSDEPKGSTEAPKDSSKEPEDSSEEPKNSSEDPKVAEKEVSEK